MAQVHGRLMDGEDTDGIPLLLNGVSLLHLNCLVVVYVVVLTWIPRMPMV